MGGGVGREVPPRPVWWVSGMSSAPRKALGLVPGGSAHDSGIGFSSTLRADPGQGAGGGVEGGSMGERGPLGGGKVRECLSILYNKPNQAWITLG